MKRLLLSLCTFLPGVCLAGQDEPSIRARAFVELHVATQRVFVGAAVDVTLRIGLEQQLAEKQLIQLFRQHLDVAVRIDTPWARPIEGFANRGAPPGFVGEASAVVDGSVTALRRGTEVLRGDRRLLIFETKARLVPTRPGPLAIPGAVLRFAWASRFEEDFFGEKVPRGRSDARLEAEKLELVVEELPTAGRPRGFRALVGQISARTSLVGPTAVRVGDNLTLRLVVQGDGDLEPFAPPGLAGLRGFHVRGVREQREPGRRIVVYDLVALRSEVESIAPISIPHFDPGPPPGYRVAVTEPVAVAVSAAADGTTAIDIHGNPVVAGKKGAITDDRPAVDAAEAVAPIPGVDVLFDMLPVAKLPPRADGTIRTDRTEFAAARPLSNLALALGLIVPWLFALGLWSLRRRAGSRERRARMRRRHRAWSAFRRATRAGCDRSEALAAYVAAWLDCAPAAVVDPALPNRLQAAGVEEELAAAIDLSLDEFAGARFGGPESTPDDAFLLELVDRVDHQLRARLRAQLRAQLRTQHSAQHRERAPRGALLISLVLGLVAASSITPPAIAQATTVPAAAASDPAAAARQFESGDTARAAAIYRRALDAGAWDPTTLCFDIGNCFHRLGRPAESVLWYTRALRVTPDHFETRANLRLVERQLGLADTDERALAWVWLDGATARVASTPAYLLLALAVAMQLLAWAVLLLRRRGRGPALVLLIAGLVLAVVVTLCNAGPAGQTAVVLRDGVRLQSEPHTRVGAVGTLKAGETIEVLEASPRWARVRRGKDTGWVESRMFESVALSRAVSAPR